MARTLGIGGIFFKAKDPDALRDWYRSHLGLEVQSWGGVAFRYSDPAAPHQDAATVWSICPAGSTYFDPSPAPFMVNYRVANLAETLAELRAKGCEVDPRTEESEYGKFAWVMDPEGNRVELWEPPPNRPPE